MSRGARGPVGRYDTVAIALHWSVALLVVAMLVLGYVMVGVPRGAPARGELFNLHKSLGVGALALMALRTGWRLAHRPPPAPPELPAWNRAVSAATHLALYVILLAQPLSGYAATEFGKYGIKVFGLALPDLARPDAGLHARFVALHHGLALGVIVLVSLHLLAALWHALRGRPGVLARMLPRLVRPLPQPLLRKAADA